MRTIRRYLLALMAVALSASPAMAASFIQISYTGVFTSGSDTAGLFGAAGESLAGKAYTASYTVDTSGVDISGAYSTTYYNVTRAASAPPVTVATLTVGGVSTLIAGSPLGYMIKSDYSNAGRHLVHFTNIVNDGSATLRADFQISLPANLASGIDTIIANTGIPAGNPSSLTLTMAGGSAATGKISSFSVATASGFPTSVPEPSIWMTMILGFGLIGGLLRVRRPAFRAI